MYVTLGKGDGGAHALLQLRDVCRVEIWPGHGPHVLVHGLTIFTKVVTNCVGQSVPALE